MARSRAMRKNGSFNSFRRAFQGKRFRNRFPRIDLSKIPLELAFHNKSLEQTGRKRQETMKMEYGTRTRWEISSEI